MPNVHIEIHPFFIHDLREKLPITTSHHQNAAPDTRVIARVREKGEEEGG